MKSLLTKCAALSGVVFFALFGQGGCGGAQDSLASEIGRGEGNIPVGRLLPPPAHRVRVSATFSTGETEFTEVDADGVFRLSKLPSGRTLITLAPGSRQFEHKTYTVVAGQHKEYVMEARLTPIPPHDVTGLQMEAFSGPLKLHEQRRIVVHVLGPNAAGLRPTLWVNGGVGSIRHDGLFIAAAPGSGSIRAELCGHTVQIPVVVR
jgi:hypothetical protein